jgi:sodium transport system permease protein
MNWSNVLLILNREIRDQLRDRRTLFMIFVLPVLLYPFMGMSMFQLMQFTQEHPTRVLVLGAEELPLRNPRTEVGMVGGTAAAAVSDELQAIPPLTVRTEELPADSVARTADGQGNDEAVWRFNPALFDEDDKAELLHVAMLSASPNPVLGTALGTGASPWILSSLETRHELARQWLKDGTYQAVVVIPPGFKTRLRQLHPMAMEQPEDAGPAVAPSQAPDIQVWHNTAKKKSEIARSRVLQVVRKWRESIVQSNLQAAGISAREMKPFDIEHGEDQDVADRRNRHAAMWSMLFPFVLLIWSLTGAFYPAVDLCAGEKERGTLETLLTSPAERSEIVWGKLLTIMAFSIGTVILNLAALGATGIFLLSRVPNLGPPPALSFVWMFLAMVPVSALFSALCLALAAFARSTKEGQYYLMPLFLITLPLVALPLSPSFELTLGNSLIPVTGIVLLLRAAIEGDYLEAFRYFGPVVMVTIACCWLAMRWAVDQFNKESVLFRESERFELGAWIRHLRRDRELTPTVPAALMCGVLILILRFFFGLAISPERVDPLMQVLVPQLVAIVFPALLMTILFTRSPRETLLLKRPAAWSVPAVVLLAVCYNPVAQVLGGAVQQMYPIPPAVEQAFQQLVGQLPGFWTTLLLFAVVPAVCEELAFRGFILSGLRHLGRKWLAILLASLFFGLTHTIAQQQIMATITGLVLGFVAVQTGSLFPAIAFHLTHNGLLVAMSRLNASVIENNSVLRLLFDVSAAGEPMLRWPVTIIGGVGSVLLLYWFYRLPAPKTEEESLQEALEHQGQSATASSL